MGRDRKKARKNKRKQKRQAKHSKQADEKKEEPVVEKKDNSVETLYGRGIPKAKGDLEVIELEYGKVFRCKHDNFNPLAVAEEAVKHWTRDIQIHSLRLQNPDGGSHLLDGSPLKFTHGHRYGLIGMNGCGKSTLLRAVVSKDIPGFPKHLRVHLVEQEMEGTDLTVLETVLASDKERTSLLKEKDEIIKGIGEHDPMRLVYIEERLIFIEADMAEYRASTVLEGLGFTDRMKNMKTADLSGGWRMRVALACGLYIEPDVLLLDEPTNHLDFPTVCWLQEYLATYSEEKTVVVVSHERGFLNEVTTDIIHMDRSRLVYYKGNYEQFHKTRAEARRHQATQYQRQQKEIEHDKDFIRRFKANKKWSTQAQSRMKRLAKLKRIEAVHNDFSWHFKFPEPEPLKNENLLDIKDMNFGYFGVDETQKTYLLTDVSVKLNIGKKVGIIGGNGAGKSTLMKMIMRELKPMSGKCFTRNEVIIGYFAQHHMEVIDVDATPLQFLRHEFPNTPLQDCYAKLGRFNLKANMGKKKIRLLSGGQKSRLAFSILTWHNPQLIIMDEPTNHLDLNTQDALIGALKDYKGSLLLVSHDKHFLTETCDTYWVVGNRTVTEFASFDKARRFCYKKCKPIDVLPREFSTINTKKKKKIPETAKIIDPSDPLGHLSKEETKQEEIPEVFIDCERQLEKGIQKGLPPTKILIHLEGWTPKDGNAGPLNILVFDMFEKFYDEIPFAEVPAETFFETYAPLVNFLIPIDHYKNQMKLLHIAQSSWALKNGKCKRVEDGSLQSIFINFLQNDYVAPETLVRWRDEDNKVMGRKEALAEVAGWISILEEAI